jgi:CRP-like cAMP-binding protein
MSSSTKFERLSNLLKSEPILTYKKGETIKPLGGSIMSTLVLSGFIIRYEIGNDGSTRIQSLYGPGDFYSLTTIFKKAFDYSLYSGPEAFHYEAISRSQVKTISTEELSAALEQDPKLYADLLLVSGSRLENYIYALENMALKDSVKRVSHQLIFFGKKFGVQITDKEIVIKMPLTHQLLSDILSLSRETVSHAVIKLRSDGYITTKGQIKILDIDKLTDYTYN